MNPNKPHTTPISDFMNAVSFRQNRLWRFTKTGLKTEVNNEWISEEEFNTRYPIPNPINFFGGKPNTDRTKDYLYN